ncbi:MAG: YlbF family regulator [Lachnospiraceae bacterium]|nr:YlbF family regulator [Lachnospiraceae bacterium]
MKNLEQALNAFVDCVKESDTYQKYVQERKQIELYPDLKWRIDEYRRRMFILQNTEDGDKLFDEVEQLEAEGASLRDNGLVNDFLAAELSFCRMMQDVYTRITAELEFDMTLGKE